MIAEVLGVRPWEQRLLTAAQLEAACDYIDEANERAKED